MLKLELCILEILKPEGQLYCNYLKLEYKYLKKKSNSNYIRNTQFTTLITLKLLKLQL